MGRYAWLTCSDCMVMVWLGKARIVGERVQAIRPVGTEQENDVLNRVIWKMFADHAGHILRVVTDLDAEYPFLGDYAEIGGDEYGDVDVETCLSGSSEEDGQ